MGHPRAGRVWNFDARMIGWLDQSTSERSQSHDDHGQGPRSAPASLSGSRVMAMLRPRRRSHAARHKPGQQQGVDLVGPGDAGAEQVAQHDVDQQRHESMTRQTDGNNASRSIPDRCLRPSARRRKGACAPPSASRRCRIIHHCRRFPEAPRRARDTARHRCRRRSSRRQRRLVRFGEGDALAFHRRLEARLPPATAGAAAARLRRRLARNPGWRRRG